MSVWAAVLDSVPMWAVRGLVLSCLHLAVEKEFTLHMADPSLILSNKKGPQVLAGIIPEHSQLVAPN